MDNDSRKMICDRCRKAVLISDVKYIPKGKDSRQALCSECRAITLSSVDRKEDKKLEERKRGYFCGRCKYKFKFDPTCSTNLKCPYCGKRDKVEETRVPPTDKLLKIVKDDF